MKKYVSDPSVKFFISVIGIFVIFFVLMELQHIFIPLVIAYFLFFFFEPLNDYLSKHKIPLAILIFINIILTSFLIYGISRVIVDSIIQFTAQLPLYEQKFNKIISETARSLHIKDYSLTHFNIARVLKKLDYSLLASGVLSSSLSVISSILLIIFFFIFISVGHDKTVEALRTRFVEKEIKSSLKKMKKEIINIENVRIDLRKTIDESVGTMTIQRELKLQQTFKTITEQVQKYIITKFLISLSLGLIMGVVLYLFKVDFFIIWAAFAIILNFIPNIGSIIAVLLPTLMALVQHESFGYAAIVAGVMIVIQNIIGNILEPKIFGDRLGLNPLVIFLSLLIWGYIWGVVGMFIAVPLTAIIKIIISNSESKNMRFITNLMSS